MEAAHTLAPKDRTTAQDNTRRCIVTGEMLPKDDLIRFVEGPDASIVPDLAQNLPGRGLWVKAEHAALKTAIEKNLFAKAAKASVKTDPELLTQLTALQRKRCLDFLGFAKRSGTAVLGQTQAEAASRAGKLALLLIADDASQTLDNRHKVAENHDFNRNELGAALGHDQLVYIGLTPNPLTKKLKAEIERLAKITNTHHIPPTNEVNGRDSRKE